MTAVIQPKVFILGISIIILFSNKGYSQHTTGRAAGYLKLSPLKLLDPVNPGLELAFELQYNQKHASQLSFTYQHSFLPEKTITGYGGFKGAFEQKYFLQKKKAQNRFIATELAWSKVHYTTQADFLLDAADPGSKYTDSFRIDKKNYSINFKYGFQFITKRFLVEFSAGLGMKYKSSSRSGLLYPGKYELQSVDPNVYRMANREGNIFILNVPVGFRLGYRL